VTRTLLEVADAQVVAGEVPVAPAEKVSIPRLLLALFPVAVIFVQVHVKLSVPPAVML
jgi:hypothetical protein